MTSSQLEWDARSKLSRMRYLIGRTPLLPIQKVFRKKGVELFAKAEWMQFGGSVKSRAAFSIVHHALEMGWLHPGKTLLDASSGNTGISYAALASSVGIPFTLCLPENASTDRKHILEKLGVQLILTSKYETTDGAQIVAKELASVYPDTYYYADQYNNPQNILAHYNGTAIEILEQTNGRITHFVCGLGTTGTFTGTSSRLKLEKPDVQLIALQPDSALHGLEGWKHLETAKIPGIYDPHLADQHIGIDTQTAYELIKDVARYEGLKLSPSSAANLAGAIAVAEKLEEGVVVTVFPDNADRYSEVMGHLFNDGITL